jgi:hypothetical protein
MWRGVPKLILEHSFLLYRKDRPVKQNPPVLSHRHDEMDGK